MVGRQSQELQELQSQELQFQELQQSADECRWQLEQLKKYAEERRTSSSTLLTAKRKYFSNVVQDANDKIRTLEAWFEELAIADQPVMLVQATGLFKVQTQWIVKAVDVLKPRSSSLKEVCSYKRMKKQLSESLEGVTFTMGALNNLSKFMRGPSAKQVDRDERKEQVVESSRKVYDAFIRGLSAINAFQNADLLSEALKVLWNEFPKRPDLENKVGNPENPGDGVLYEEKDVVNAMSVLKDFTTAWLKTEALNYKPPPPRLQEMSRICLILTGMREQGLLVHFLEGGLTDSDLRLDIQKLTDILKENPEGHRPNANLFYTEQSRAKPREWAEETHMIFKEEEPMPLAYIDLESYRGSYASITKVRDPFTGNVYARKQQQITLDKKGMQSNREHVEQETQLLKGLRHRHVVQFVKSYERGKLYGLIMKPAAHYDLEVLLGKPNKEYNNQQKCLNMDWLHPLFRFAFGCLAQGLAYIHRCNLRHKDVKPNNILYEQLHANNGHHPASNNSGRFLWADFGLAYDFSDKKDSKTQSTDLHSERYAPPEVVAAAAKGKYNLMAKLDEIKTNEEVMFDREKNPKASGGDIEAHGRAADSFSLGCVYLELLSRLVEHDLPLQENHEGRALFSDNIDCLCDWAAEKKRVEELTELWPLFDVAIDMIDGNPDRRPKINDVVDRVMTAGQKFSCETCRHEYQTQQTNKSLTISPTSVATPPTSHQSQTSSRRILNEIGSSMLMRKSQSRTS